MDRPPCDDQWGQQASVSAVITDPSRENFDGLFEIWVERVVNT